MKNISTLNFCKFLKENKLVWNGFYRSMYETTHIADLAVSNISLNSNLISKIKLSNLKGMSKYFDLILSDKTFILIDNNKKIDLSRRWRNFLKKLQKYDSTELVK